MLLMANSDAENLENDWNPGTWVLVWEYPERGLSNEYQHDRVQMV